MIFTNDIENDFRIELLRKLIHLSYIAIPVIYYFITKTLLLQILTLLAVVSLSVDMARYFSNSFSALFDKIFGFLLRQHERGLHAKNLNGATRNFIAAVVCVAVFPKYITIISFAILTFADLASALVGRRFGRRRFRGRSLEGSMAFIAAAVVVVALSPKIEYRFSEYLIGALAAIIGAAAEVFSHDRIDDNITIPISTGATMWLLYALIHPAMNLEKFGLYN
jgi:dolichol kinase